MQDAFIATNGKGNISLPLLLIGSSFKSAPIDFREELFGLLSDSETRSRIQDLPSVRESCLLITCNRIELYLATFNREEVTRGFFSIISKGLRNFNESNFYVLNGIEVVKHIIKVSSGLDSVAIGEEQILHQVRETITKERTKGYSKAILSSLFDMAIDVARGIRSKIGQQGYFSSSELAIKVAIKKLGKDPRSILVIGSGKMAKLALKELGRNGHELFVATRRGDSNVDGEGARIIGYDALNEVAGRCDLIISATSGRFVLTKGEDLARGEKVIIDLGFPRNIDPSLGKLENITLLNLDDLAKEREDIQVGAEVEIEIEKEAERFASRLKITRLTNTIPTIYKFAECVRREELERLERKLPNLDERERMIITAMSKRLVSRILAKPIEFIRASNGSELQERIRLVEEVFGID